MRGLILRWIILMILAIVMCAVIVMTMIYLPPLHGDGRNLTMEQAGSEPVPPDSIDLLIGAIIIGFIAVIVAIIMEHGRERCPSCGEILRLVEEVQKYKCLHCGSWYPREDIEVEVIP